MPEEADEAFVKSFIWKRNALRGDQSLHLGISNHCQKDDAFHLYLDCDDVKLRHLFDGIAIMQKEFSELRGEQFLIALSSPFHFFLASFPILSWNRYVEMMWYAVDIGIEHYGHAFRSEGKGYAVLRTGGKDGITPRILYSLGDRVGCKICANEFREDVEQWQDV